MTCISTLEIGKPLFSEAATIVEETGKYKGFEYLVTFTPRGHRCGYVAINDNHPLYGKSDECDIDLDMHGGCTFFDFQKTDQKCTDKWIGFDCAHVGDRPDHETRIKYFGECTVDQEAEQLMFRALYRALGIWSSEYGSIRGKDFVAGECKRIIDQLTA